MFSKKKQLRLFSSGNSEYCCCAALPNALNVLSGFNNKEGVAEKAIVFTSSVFLMLSWTTDHSDVKEKPQVHVDLPIKITIPTILFSFDEISCLMKSN